MEESVYPVATGELAQRRKELAPATHDAFQAFSTQVFADGALKGKTKQLNAVAVAHVTQCPYCIRGHTRAALRKGATEPELMEAIWVAAEMRAGGAYAHSTLALDTAAHAHGPRAGDRVPDPASTAEDALVAPRVRSGRAARSHRATGAGCHRL